MPRACGTLRVWSLWLTEAPRPPVLKVRPRCSPCRNPLLLQAESCCIVCVDRARCVYSVSGHASCSHVVATVDNTARNAGVGYLFETLLLFLLGCIPRRGIAGSCPNSVFNSLGDRHSVVHTAAVPFHVPAISCSRDFLRVDSSASTSPPALVLFCDFDTSHPGRCGWHLLFVEEP